jgi:hypothetical protein
MKDRASGGSIGRRLIWSGRVVFIGRDGLRRCDRERGHSRFHRVTHRAPPVPLGSRGREVSYKLQVVRHAWVGGRSRQHPASRDHYGAATRINWARDKSLFDLAMNRMEALVYKVRQSAS